MTIMAKILAVDHTFKCVRKLMQNGNPIYKALWVAVNEYGQVRMAAWAHSTGQAETQAAITAFNTTSESLGAPPLQAFYLDNPRADAKFYASQFKFVSVALPPEPVMANLPELALPGNAAVWAIKCGCQRATCDSD